MWNNIKLAIWKLANLFGPEWGDRAWTYYSILRIFYYKYFLRTYVIEPEGKLLKDIINKNDICLDIGANIGTYTCLLSNLVGPNGKVFSFEPLPRTFVVIKRVAQLFNLKNSTILQLCVGDRDGFIEFTGFTGRPGRTYTAGIKVASDNESDCQKVPIITIDTFASQYGIDRVDFIKCDVEGATLFVLNGARKIIKRYSPKILCEIADFGIKRYGYSPKDIFNLLQSFGYSSYKLHEGKLVEIAHQEKKTSNYIFIKS